MTDFYEVTYVRNAREYTYRQGSCIECMRLNNKEWHANNPARAMLRSAKKRASANGVPFELTIEDIKIPKKCPVLGIPLIAGAVNGGSTNNSPSIDRIKPELGYVVGNILIVSMLANQIKSSATPEQIMKVAQFYTAL